MRKATGSRLLIRTMVLISILLLAGIGMLPSDTSARATQAALETSQMTLPAITDAWVSEGYSTAACGNEAYLAAGYDRVSGQHGRVRSFLKFDLTNLPEAATINQAILYLYFSDFGGPLLGNFPIRVARISGPWAENSVQWNTAPGIDLTTTVSSTVNHTNPVQKTWVSMDVTELVQGWLQGQYPNYGVALLGSEEISLNSVLEFFDSSESSPNAPYLEITFQVPSKPASLPGEPQPLKIFLPLLLSKYPPTLDLHPIHNDGGEGSYIISWTPLPVGTWTYELYEWTGNAWQMIFSPSSGATSLIVNNKPLGTYSYFLKATSEERSEQSVIRSVTVSDLPDQFAFLVIGIGDYQNMPSSYTLYAQMGNDLKYPIYDATDIQDMLKVYGATSGEPFGQVLTLLNSRATKTGIQNAITGWLDSHEAANTTVFIYFSGHTLVSDQKPYLAPFDLTCSPCADLSTNSTWLPSSGISAEEINSWLGELASTHFIFIIDSQGSERWISELRENDRTILAGSRTTEDRWEFNEIRNGAFSYYLNQAYLNNADLDLDGKVSIQEIYSYTYSPPTLSSFVYNHSILIKDGQNQQHAVLNSGAYSTLGFLTTTSVQACHQMP